MKSLKSLDTVYIYIYIYIIGFNKISLCKRRIRTMFFRRI